MLCRICSSEELAPVIDLGMQPWGNCFLTKAKLGKEPFYPLRVVYCLECQLSQLDFSLSKEVMFSDHTYLSGMSDSLSAHFRRVAETVDRRFFASEKEKSTLDIGSNDGTQLKHYKALGYDVLGVESSKRTAKIANDSGIKTLNAFFNEQVVSDIGREFDVINASGVFFHLDELHSVCRAIKKGLKKRGVFVIQYLYMKSIMEHLNFDQIYHEHLLYYTFKTLERLLDMHGLESFDAELSPVHGGSVISYVGHAGLAKPSDRLQTLRKEEQESNCNSIEAYRSFNGKIKGVKERNLAFLEAAREEGKKVYGFGAPVKGNTLLNYFGIDSNLVERLVEKNPLRRGLFSPGMHIPVVIEDELEEQPDIYYALAWNLKEEIMRKRRDLLKEGGVFYFPIECTMMGRD